MGRIVLVCIALLALVGVQWSADSVEAQTERCFPETGQCISGRFRTYWEQNGGLAVFGFPTTPAANEVNRDTGKTYLTQWFERNRFELHTENPAPYDVLLGRLGDDRLRQQGVNWESLPRAAGPQNGCLWFEQTRHNICDQGAGVGFKTYWQTHGLNDPKLDAFQRSLALFGLPLSEPRMETNSSGDTVSTQWFERARFEWHPNKPNEFKVLLGLLGRETRAPAPVPPPPSRPSIFGVEINRARAEATAPRAAEAGVAWVRYGAIEWNEVEPSPGARSWNRIAQAERDIAAIASRGLIPMVIVRGAPAWAQKVAGADCGPVKQDALDELATFMRDVVTRYSRAPYNVKHWELWNEPDIAPGLVEDDSGFGCWGDNSDAFYGGGYYGEMLKRVYPVMKQADPAATIIVGGLLLDCDPGAPPAGTDCKPAKFYEGMLRAGAGNSFDILAYHAYMYWGPGTQDWDREQPRWKHRGGALEGKRAFLQSVGSRYGVDKPILMNEGGLLCYPGTTCAPEPFRAAQANYLVRMYTRAWANNLFGAVWYTLNGPGWREGGLLDRSGSPRPAYNTLKFMTAILKDATYSGRLSNDALEGYGFRRGDTTIQVYWMNNGETRSVGLPAGTRAVYNTAGTNIMPSGGSVRVTFEPIFIEIR